MILELSKCSLWLLCGIIKPTKKGKRKPRFTLILIILSAFRQLYDLSPVEDGGEIHVGMRAKNRIEGTLDQGSKPTRSAHEVGTRRNPYRESL